MYSFDPNINTAVERQADRVRAVRAYGTSQTPAQHASDGGASAQGAPNPLKSKLTLAFAAAAPVVLMAVWAMLLR